MTINTLPLILESASLESSLDQAEVRLVEVGKSEAYTQEHIPGAYLVEYDRLVRQAGPAAGLVPDDNDLSRIFSEIGLTPDTHIVAYDVEGGGRASRLLWTLAWVGHRRFSLLNGGVWSWEEGNRPLSSKAPDPLDTGYTVHSHNERILVDLPYVREHLNDPAIRLLDTRSPGEFSGRTRQAKHAGHIPGAVNLDWVLCTNPADNLRLHSRDVLENMLRERGIRREHEVIVYCQTHHRSSLVYIVLKHLGYENVRAYAGSWSEWGNRDDTPIE